MRALIFSTSIFFLYSITISQVLNPSFELWTTVNPGTTNEYSYPNNWSVFPNQSISKSTIAHAGLYSCRGAVVKDTFNNDTVVPFLIGKFSMQQHYAKFTGYYQFTSASNCTGPYAGSLP